MYGDEEPLQGVAGGGLGAAGSGERLGKVAAGAAEGGKEPAKQGGGDSAEERVENDGRVEVNFRGAREGVGEEMEGAGGGGGDAEAEEGAEEGEGKDFGEELADDGAARGAEREADGDFVFAIGGAGEEQRGDIGASDEQKQR